MLLSVEFCVQNHKTTYLTCFVIINWLRLSGHWSMVISGSQKRYFQILDILSDRRVFGWPMMLTQMGI